MSLVGKDILGQAKADAEKFSGPQMPKGNHTLTVQDVYMDETYRNKDPRLNVSLGKEGYKPIILSGIFSQRTIKNLKFFLSNLYKLFPEMQISPPSAAESKTPIQEAKAYSSQLESLKGMKAEVMVRHEQILITDIKDDGTESKSLIEVAKFWYGHPEGYKLVERDPDELVKKLNVEDKAAWDAYQSEQDLDPSMGEDPQAEEVFEDKPEEEDGDIFV